MKKTHVKILSSLMVNFSVSEPRTSPSPELLQVKFINCYLREKISFTRKNDIRDWTSLDSFQSRCIVADKDSNETRLGTCKCEYTFKV